MRSTQQFSITLPNEMAEAVRAKVASGEYATESEVIRDGLRVLLARDRAVEEWLRKDVATTFDAMKADPSRAVSPSASRHAWRPRQKGARENLMRYEVVFAPEADDQLEELFLYIAERDSVATAEGYTGAIIATCEALATSRSEVYRVMTSGPACASRITRDARSSRTQSTRPRSESRSWACTTVDGTTSHLLAPDHDN